MCDERKKKIRKEEEETAYISEGYIDSGKRTKMAEEKDFF